MNNIFSSNRDYLIKLLILTLLFLLIVVFYLGVAFNVPYYADHAALMVMAKSILEGNILLEGWTLATQSFITTELPFYVLSVLILGFSSDVIYILTALHWSFIVVLVIYISAVDENGNISINKAFVSFCLTFYLATFITKNDYLASGHLVGFSYLLICLQSIRKIEKGGRKIHYMIFTVFLVLALVGDSFALYIMVLPVALVCFIKLLCNQPKNTVIQKDSTTDEEALTTRNFVKKFITKTHFFPGNETPITLLLVIVISVLLSRAILNLIDILGGPNVPGFGAYFVSLPQFGNNLSLLVNGNLLLFGVDLFGKPFISYDSIIGIARLSGLLLFLFALYFLAKKIHKQTIATQVMFIIVITNQLEYLFSNAPVNLATTRYLVPSLIFGIILLTNFVCESKIFSIRKNLILIYFLILSISLIPPLTYSHPKLPIAELASFLARKHLTNGYGSYWIANNTTLYTEEEVSIRGVHSINGLTIQPFYWVSDEKWYKEDANFLVVDRDDNQFPLTQEQAVNTFGKPSQQYDLGKYTIYVWDYNISTHLSVP